VHGTTPAMRFRFHDLVRLYARDLPGALGTGREALIRVIGLLLSLAERADEALPGTSDIGVRGQAPRYPGEDAVTGGVVAAPVEWFTTERRSIAQAVEAAAAEGLSEQAWELAAATRTFAALRSEWDLWRGTHEVALQACSDAGNRRGMASMLLGLGKLKIDSHVVSGGAPVELRRAVELYNEIGDAAGEAQALIELASFLEMTDDLADSVRYAERAARLAMSVQAEDLVADIYFVWGRASRKRGDFNGARPLLGRALDQYRRLGKARGEAQVKWDLAALHRELGELDRAEELLESCTEGLRAIGDRRGLTRVLIDLALTVSQAGRTAEARRHLTEAVEICHELGERSFLARASDALADLLLTDGQPSEATEHAGVAEGIWTALGDDVRAESSRQRRTAAEDAAGLR
jgi:tetratricopeptide (TPR) repeat protein